MHDTRRGRWRAVPTAEQSEAFTRALVWREAWRAEVAAKKGSEAISPLPATGDEPGTRGRNASRGEAERRAVYARQMARSELGRSYWNEQQARGLREAMERSALPKPQTAIRNPRRGS